VFSAILSACDYRVIAQAPPSPSVATPAFAVGDSEIGGTVTSRFGPEPGVWVIAETRDLGTGFAKIVVTDEHGRYLLPDLPHDHYRVWVRGYGLVDSPKVDTCFGTHHLNFAEDANDTLVLQQHEPPARRRRLGEHEALLGDGRPGEIAGLDAADRRHDGNRQAGESFNEPGAPAAPGKNTRIPFGMYAIS
jgi:hypothetical protein